MIAGYLVPRLQEKVTRPKSKAIIRINLADMLVAKILWDWSLWLDQQPSMFVQHCWLTSTSLATEQSVDRRQAFHMVRK